MTMSDHAWARRRLAGYLAGNLTPRARLRFEEHVGDCTQCATVLAEVKGLDHSLRGLFAGARPSANLEERTLRALRKAYPTVNGRRAWSWPMKAMLVAASLLLLVGTGAFLS